MMEELKKYLTVVVPTKNEEKNLPACLENVRELAHVVIVDSASVDATVKIATDRGREVVGFTWNGRFPKKRNWLLRNYSFKTPWVMFLDADERMTEAFKEELATFLASKESERCDVIRCFYDNWFMGRMLRHGDVMQKTAILRVGAAEYERIEEDHWSDLDMEIHEHIIPRREGAEHTIVARLEHHDKRSLESYFRKHEEYAKWEANRYRMLIAKYGAIANVPNLTVRQRQKYANITKWWLAPAYFVVSYILKRGFLDGRAGFIFACGKMRYFWKIRKLLLSFVRHDE